MVELLLSSVSELFLFTHHRRPELGRGEDLRAVKQPDDQRVEHERDGKLDRTRGQLRQEKRLKCVAAVDLGEREALPQDGARA